jgi:ADP-ribose pyrophosphatase YjhB (NUDIX family)
MYNSSLNAGYFNNDEIKYCTKCASNVEYELPPDGDNHKRYVCTKCKHVHYQNPKVVIGTISIHDNKILLCKRGIEPRYGYWTLPAGFMENGETTFNGAWRETFEEATAKVDIQKLFAVINIPKIGQVHMFYLAKFDGVYSSGTESLDTALFDLNNIPWDNLAFPSVESALKSYIEYVSIINDKNYINLPYHHTVIPHD